MRNAVLTCRCTSFYISEMNKTYYLGEQIVLSEETYNKPYIKKAIELGVFSVRWTQECRMKKPQSHKAPPFIRVGGRKAPAKTSPQPTPASDLNLSGLDQLLTSIIRRELQTVKQEILQELSSQTIVPPQKQQEIVEATPQPKAEPVEDLWDDEDEPIYIPSDITSSGKVSGTMSVESVGTDSSVTDAAAALRAMKKKRRKNK